MILGIIMGALVIVAGALLWANYERYERISFKDSVDLTGNPIIIFENNNRKLHFLLDTGANRSMINQKELETCDYKETGEYSSNIGIEAQQTLLPNIYMQLEYKKAKYEESFLVRDLSGAFDAIKEETGVTVHGILGTSFFTRYKYVLDFDELVAYSKKKL